MRNFIVPLLLLLTINLFSCKDEDPLIDSSNLTGEFFKRITEENQVKEIWVYRTVSATYDDITRWKYYDFPGNNFIRVGEDSGGQFDNVVSYNLDNVIWYEVDTKTLRIKFNE
jgi:hypothetical protein